MDPLNPALERLHVLVVDDEEDMRLYLKSCLRRLEIPALTVTTASSSSEALDRLGTTPPVDLLVADLRLPGMDGLGLAQAMLARPGFEDMAVLLVTGETSWVAEARAFVRVGGRRRLLTKPFNAAQFVAMANELVG
jgi:two-component system chemotaxis response regulator CheY